MLYIIRLVYPGDNASEHETENYERAVYLIKSLPTRQMTCEEAQHTIDTLAEDPGRAYYQTTESENEEE